MQQLHQYAKLHSSGSTAAAAAAAAAQHSTATLRLHWQLIADLDKLAVSSQHKSIQRSSSFAAVGCCLQQLEAVKPAGEGVVMQVAQGYRLQPALVAILRNTIVGRPLWSSIWNGCG